MISFLAGLMQVHIYNDRAELGRAAALRIADSMRSQLGDVRSISAVFASAPSQTETLEALAVERGIAWDRVTAFHLDEYVGARADSTYSFRRYLVDNLLSKVLPAGFEGLRGEAEDLHAECLRYAAEWTSRAPVLGLLGIGENGHIAFNDPPHSRFLESEVVRIVDLTDECRVQQVHDATFANLDAVPKQALTVSIPPIQQIPELFVIVPGIRKAEAVRASLEGPISEECPASILRVHPRATLFLDRDSASLLSISRASTAGTALS